MDLKNLEDYTYAVHMPLGNTTNTYIYDVAIYIVLDIYK